MKLQELLVSLLLLLPFKEEILICTPNSQTGYKRVHQYLTPIKEKARGKLGKSVSQTEVDALLYSIGIIRMNNGKETFQMEKFTQVINSTTGCAIQFNLKSEKLGSAKPGSPSETIHILQIIGNDGYAADEDIFSSAHSMLEKSARLYSTSRSSTNPSPERRSKHHHFVSPTHANADPANAAPANAAPSGGELLYDTDTDIADADDTAAADDDDAADDGVDAAADELSSKLQEAEELDFSVEERYLPNGEPVKKCDLSYDSQQMLAEISFTCFSHF